MTPNGASASSSESTDPAIRLPRRLWAVALTAPLVELALAWNTHGTNDVDAFRQYKEERVRFGAVATYANDPDFKHPPFVFHFQLGLRGFIAAPPAVCDSRRDRGRQRCSASMTWPT